MDKKVKISANEVNRYMYCPYQWYYSKHYGQKTLKAKYQALASRTSGHEGNFQKGLNFHSKYYKQYKAKRRLQIILIVTLMIILGSLVEWYISY